MRWIALVAVAGGCAIGDPVVDAFPGPGEEGQRCDLPAASACLADLSGPPVAPWPPEAFEPQPAESCAGAFFPGPDCARLESGQNELIGGGLVACAPAAPVPVSGRMTIADSDLSCARLRFAAVGTGARLEITRSILTGAEIALEGDIELVVSGGSVEHAVLRAETGATIALRSVPTLDHVLIVGGEVTIERASAQELSVRADAFRIERSSVTTGFFEADRIEIESTAVTTGRFETDSLAVDDGTFIGIGVVAADGSISASRLDQVDLQTSGTFLIAGCQVRQGRLHAPGEPLRVSVSELTSLGAWGSFELVSTSLFQSTVGVGSDLVGLRATVTRTSLCGPLAVALHDSRVECSACRGLEPEEICATDVTVTPEEDTLCTIVAEAPSCPGPPEIGPPSPAPP